MNQYSIGSCWATDRYYWVGWMYTTDLESLFRSTNGLNECWSWIHYQPHRNPFHLIPSRQCWMYLLLTNQWIWWLVIVILTNELSSPTSNSFEITSCWRPPCNWLCQDWNLCVNLGILRLDSTPTTGWRSKLSAPSWTIKEVKTLLSCWRDEGL